MTPEEEAAVTIARDLPTRCVEVLDALQSLLDHDQSFAAAMTTAVAAVAVGASVARRSIHQDGTSEAGRIMFTELMARAIATEMGYDIVRDDGVEFDIVIDPPPKGQVH